MAKYLRRQCGAAAEKLAAHLQRKRELSPVASVEYRWSGRVRHGPESLAALDTYVSVAVANNRLVGGRQGAWLIADFHASSVRPAMQALVTADAEGNTLLSGGVVRRERDWLSSGGLNATTLTYTADLCLEVTPDPDGGTPRVGFSRMSYMCS